MNLATSTAHITRADPGASAEQLIAAVEAIGYGVAPLRDQPPAEAAGAEAADTEGARISGPRRRLIASAVLGLPVRRVDDLCSALPGLAWLALGLATPVIAGGPGRCTELRP